MLLGDFNRRIRNLQTQYFDSIADLLHIQALDRQLVFQKDFANSLPTSGYGRFLLELGETHNLLIFNGIVQFPQSDHHTYFPHVGGSSVVDYILSSPPLASHIHAFQVAHHLLLADHTHLTFSLGEHLPLSSPPGVPTPRAPRTTILFDREHDPLYNHIL